MKNTKHSDLDKTSLKQEQALSSEDPWTWWPQCSLLSSPGHKTFGQKWFHPSRYCSDESQIVPAEHPEDDQTGTWQRTSCCSSPLLVLWSSNLPAFDQGQIPSAVCNIDGRSGGGEWRDGYWWWCTWHCHSESAGCQAGCEEDVFCRLQCSAFFLWSWLKQKILY